MAVPLASIRFDSLNRFNSLQFRSRMYFFPFFLSFYLPYTHFVAHFKCCTVLLDFFLLYLSSTITLFIQFLFFSRSSDPNAYLAHQSTKAQKHHFNLFLRLNFQKSFFTAYRYHDQICIPTFELFETLIQSKRNGMFYRQIMISSFSNLRLSCSTLIARRHLVIYSLFAFSLKFQSCFRLPTGLLFFNTIFFFLHFIVWILFTP